MNLGEYYSAHYLAADLEREGMTIGGGRDRITLHVIPDHPCWEKFQLSSGNTMFACETVEEARAFVAGIAHFRQLLTYAVAAGYDVCGTLKE